MRLKDKIKALLLRPLIIAGAIAITATISTDANAQTSTNGFCKYENVTEVVPNYILDADGNIIMIAGRPAQNGTKNVDKLKVTIDSTKVESVGGIINVSSSESCPLPGRSYKGLAVDGTTGAISNDYLFSGVICVVQAIISESMLKVYCSILYWMKTAIDSAMVIYIMLYGLAIMFDLGNNPARNAVKNFLKVVIIYLLATNATMAYNWLYKSFIIVINGFSEILTREMIYDDSGQLIYDINGVPYLKNGTKFDPTLATGTDIISKYMSNPFNIRIPKQQYYFVPDTANPKTGEFKPVFESEKQCDYLKRKYADLRTRYPGSKDNFWPDSTRPITDAEIEAGKLGDCSVLIVKLDKDKQYKAQRYFKDGSLGCEPRVNLNKCARPFNGIIGKFDSMFKNIVGNNSAKGLMGLAGAFAGVSVGGGPILAMILVSGVMAMFFAFFNMLFTFVSSMMGVTFMFMLAPVFIPFALFTVTFDYFKRWLSTVISFGMQPILVLAFLLILGQISSINSLAEVNKNVVDQSISRDLGGINFEAIFPGFQAPLFGIPMGEKDNQYFNNINNTSEDGKSLVVSLESLKSWRSAKLADVKLQYMLEKWGYGTITKGDYENFSVPQFTNPTALEYWNANGESIKNPIDDPNKKTLSSRDENGVSYQTLMRKLLSDATADDDFITNINNVDGLNKVLADPQYADFKTLYEKQIGKKIYCESNCPIDPDTHQAPDKVNLCISNCPEKSDGTQIDVFTNDKTLIDACSKNCMYLKGGVEKFMGERNFDLLLFLILSMATASFVGLIPGLCKKLTHWSPGAGAAQGQMSALSLFGGSKRHLAAGEYSAGESGGVFHPGAMFDTGLDGGRPGALIAGADKIFSSISGGGMKNPIATLLDGGVRGLEGQMKSSTYQYVEGKMQDSLRDGTGYDGKTDDLSRKMAEVAQSKGESGKARYQELIDAEMELGNYANREASMQNVEDALEQEARAALERDRAQAEKEKK